MEASAFPATVGVARPRIAISAPLLRFRSDEQLISLFRAGSEDAFRVIHDRYRARMLAYTRQMLSNSSADAEDAVQEIFVRAYAGLLADNRRLALRAWLYRVAHNRCIDELRRPQVQPSDQVATADPDTSRDPVARLEQRDALERLIADVQRLPEQQRSALLMRELGGMTYVDVAAALTVTVPAVKSLLVRARVGLAQASEARDTACATIREDLILSHDRGVRASGLARRHLRDCPDCRAFRNDVRGVSRQLAAVMPGLGPAAMVAKLLGLGGSGGAAAGGGALASGSASAAGAATAGSVTGGALSLGSIAGAGHVATILAAAAVVTAGGAIELQHITPAAPHHATHHRLAMPAPAPVAAPAATPAVAATQSGAADPVQTAAVGADAASGVPSFGPAAATRTASVSHAARSHTAPALSELLDPDMMQVFPVPGPVSTPTGSTAGSAVGAGTSTNGSTTTATGTTTSSGSTAAAGASSTPASTSAASGTASTGSGQTATTTGTPSTTASTGTSSTANGSTTPSGTAGTSSTASGQSAPATPATTAGGTTAGSQTATRTAHPAQVVRSGASGTTTSGSTRHHRAGSEGTSRARHGIMAVFTLTETH